MVFQPRPIVVAGCLLALAGCTSDPNQAGFLSGVYNIASGTYDQQAAELKAEAAAAAARRAELRAEAQRLDAEIAQLQPEQPRPAAGDAEPAAEPGAGRGSGPA